jgi:hypothetical protein
MKTFQNDHTLKITLVVITNCVESLISWSNAGKRSSFKLQIDAATKVSFTDIGTLMFRSTTGHTRSDMVGREEDSYQTRRV